MSASLVGSEMCIRDRLVAAWWLLPQRSLSRSDQRGRLARTTCLISEAVSYTHLTLPTICSV
eukprot:4781153-Alexandrium_andersonii.AAC.1